MKIDHDLSRSDPLTSKSTTFVGRFIRRQGNYGSVFVVGRVENRKVTLFDDPKRVFPRDGLVEVHGAGHMRLAAGDWIEFDVKKNQRPRAPQYKTDRLSRLPRYAVLPEAEPLTYRTLLTSQGWRGGKRPGRWALRISDGRVLVVELEAENGGALRIPRKLAREVHWYSYSDELIVRLPVDDAGEEIFMVSLVGPSGTLDWSDETDHMLRVIRSLSDANDPRVADLISWLELHNAGSPSRDFVATLDHDAAQASLRSGELAKRLRANRELMQAYVDAASQDVRVREALAEWAREGNGVQAERLRSELAREIADNRTRLKTELTDEIKRLRMASIQRLDTEMSVLAEERHRAVELNARKAEERVASKLKNLNDQLDDRNKLIDQEIARREAELSAVRGATEAAINDLKQIQADTEEARSRLREAAAEVDRLMAVADRLGSSNALGTPKMSALPSTGLRCRFPERQTASVEDKGRAIATNPLLTSSGKDLLRQLVILMLAGEVPILIGPDARGLLQVAEALICPGRFTAVDADPALISVDDLWSRPGSGAPTLVASAAEAAETGAVMVAIRRIERSGARFWFPALRDALRGGGLPRGLLVCGTVGERDHEELTALKEQFVWVTAEGAFIEGAFAAAPALLSASTRDLTVIDPGAVPDDLSQATPIVLELGFRPSLEEAIQIARIFGVAKALLGNEADARRITKHLALKVRSNDSAV